MKKILFTSHVPLNAVGSATYIMDLAQLAKNIYSIGIVGFIGMERNCNFSYWSDISHLHPIICFNHHPAALSTVSALNSTELDTYAKICTEELRRAVREFQPDLIHVNHLSYFAKASSEIDAHFLVTAHGPEIEELRRERSKNLRFSISSGVDTIIVCSEYMRQSVMCAMQMDESSLLLVPSGPRLSIVNSTKTIGRSDKFKVIYGGKFTPEKNIDVILRAIELFTELDNVEFHLYGDYTNHSIAQEHSKKFCRFLYLHGLLSRSTFLEKVRLSDAYISPCPTEGLGLSALEALQCGVPVIAAKGGAHLEYITDKNGFLFDSDDEVMLSNIIRRCRDQEKKNIHQISDVVREKYNSERHCHLVSEVYSRMTDGE